ncbi:MAG: aminoacyl-tRNA hydrolase [Patescibacteria group bacterium]|nr:aminoacyl-tRNA hydrolase [Patescibacteria group bacterium]
MFLIVGLGNPGLKYRKTRHNIGFRVLDVFQKENDFPKFKLDKKSRAEISKGIVNNQEILLAKPQTFMNSSGFAVKALVGNWKLEIGNCIVVHDDFDLPFGEVKTKQSGSSGGHHGVQSIIDVLKTQNFTRLRVGTRPILKLETQNSKLESKELKAKDFVLKKFSREEEKLLPQILKTANENLLSLLY